MKISVVNDLKSLTIFKKGSVVEVCFILLNVDVNYKFNDFDADFPENINLVVSKIYLSKKSKKRKSLKRRLGYRT